MKIAVIFDFDQTLAPETMVEPVLRSWGMEPKAFWDSCSALQGVDGFDLEHSYLYRLAEEGRLDVGRRLDAVKLRGWGKEVALYPGLSDSPEGPGLFKAMKDACGPGQLELFVISGGLRPMIQGCLESQGLDRYFSELFACRMAEEDPGDGLGSRLSFPKETIGYTVKTQKLFAIAKGSWRGSDAPGINDKVRPEDLRVPFKQMLYLGDGHSDVAAFALLRQFGGTSLAVHHPGDAQGEAKARAYSLDQRRAHGHFEADYRPGSALRQAILNWLRSAAQGQAQGQFGFVQA